MNTVLPKEKTKRRWIATLDARIESKNGVSYLRSARHLGPLRIQKPYRQTDGSLHVYLLHPPGGVVSGDELTINIDCDVGSRVLFTSPAAGKFYRCLTSTRQYQTVRINIQDDAHVEWLPQETIFFNGAQAMLETHVSLPATSSYLGQEIQTLGRKASGESFVKGHVDQRTQIRQSGRLIHRERQWFEDRFSKQPWALQSAHVVGTLVAVPMLERTGSISEALACLRDRFFEPEWGITWRGRTMLVRYLGMSIEDCRTGFDLARQLMSGAGLFAGRELTERPRIWNT